MSDRAIALAEWNNIWRRGDPFSLHEKRAFLRANGFSFARMFLKFVLGVSAILDSRNA